MDNMIRSSMHFSSYITDLFEGFKSHNSLIMNIWVFSFHRFYE